MTEQEQLWASELRDDGFRPVHYLGSKYRLLADIAAAIDELAPPGGRALDLFSGSGVVAARLARTRPVIAVDVQEYARVLASALLSPVQLDPAPLVDAATEHVGAAAGAKPLLDVERHAVDALERGDPELLAAIVEDGAPVLHAAGADPTSPVLAAAIAAAHLPAYATLTRHYGGVYFAYEQTLQLDALLKVIRELDGTARDTALAAALGTASECVSSVGNHFAQPVRPRDASGQVKVGVIRAVARRRRINPFEVFAQRLRCYGAREPSSHDVRAVRADFRDPLADEIAVVYADPPYTRDHYSRFYHVLETMAQGDDPEVSTVKTRGRTSLSRGIYRRSRHQSPFCIRSKVADAFTALFSGARERNVPLVLSYSPSRNGTVARPQTRLLPIEGVVALAEEQFADVNVRTVSGVAHSKFNASRLNAAQDPDAEVLLLCTP